MALSSRQQAEVSRQLSAYCEARIPQPVRHQLRVGFRIRGNEVVLFE
jgi:hypothetical protein